jgi:hypothetical protein
MYGSTYRFESVAERFGDLLRRSLIKKYGIARQTRLAHSRLEVSPGGHDLLFQNYRLYTE